MGVANRECSVPLIKFGTKNPKRFLWKYVAGKFQVFKWTGKNDYVALCEPGFLSFGGGYRFLFSSDFR